MNINPPNSVLPGSLRNLSRDFKDFPHTEAFVGGDLDPDLDVTASAFGGDAAPPEQLADLWLETSSARRWRQTLWLALGFGAVVGSVFTTACFLLLPGTLRALGLSSH